MCQLRKGQSELMGSICCTQIPFILIAISQSHCLPLLVLYSANPQVDPKTHIGTVVLSLCHNSHDPLCLCLYVLCLDSLFIIIVSYCTFYSRLWRFCLLSAPLWFHCLHTPYCYLFLAIGPCADPALNLLVYK